MWVFVKRETGEQQWERLLAVGPSERSWSHIALSKLPCESEHWERTRWQGTGETWRKEERDKEKEETEREWERGCVERERVSELDHAVKVRGAAVWWTAVWGCAHSAERLPEGRQNGAHHYAAKGSAGLALSLTRSLFFTLVTSLLFPTHHRHSTSVILWKWGRCLSEPCASETTTCRDQG